MRSLVAFVAAVALTAGPLSGCGSDDTEPTSSADDRPSSSASSEAPEESPLEGSWQTTTVSLEDLEATIRANGLGQWVEDFRANAPFTDDLVLTLTIENGAWDLYGETSTGVGVPIDYNAEYEIDGDTVVFEHSDGTNTHRWSVDGDTLTFEYVGTTLPPYQGIPNEVYQRALYMTAEFTKRG